MRQDLIHICSTLRPTARNVSLHFTLAFLAAGNWFSMVVRSTCGDKCGTRGRIWSNLTLAIPCSVQFGFPKKSNNQIIQAQASSIQGSKS